MARSDPQLKLRLPADLKAWVEEAAAQNQRSVNAEIVHLLLQARHNGRIMENPALLLAGGESALNIVRKMASLSEEAKLYLDATHRRDRDKF